MSFETTSSFYSLYCTGLLVFESYHVARTGRVFHVEREDFPDELKKYYNEYQQKKIKRELVDKLGLVTYSRRTRGFYVSFRLSLDDLVFEAEKQRKKVKQKAQKDKIDSAYQKAIDRLNAKPP